MRSDKLCKTVRQYNKEPISEEDMSKLQEIAADYSQVKNYVYNRYGGIKSLPKIYPGYTVQNEMTATGLRGASGLPSVYFYLAIFDALADIKSQWIRTKSKVSQLLSANKHFTKEEKHYLRFLLKVNNAFTAVLNQTPIELQGEIQKAYEKAAAEVDTEKLHRYLCRQVRKYHKKQHTDMAEGFSTAKQAYRYADHGIYIATKQNRKRIFVPLTDNNHYKSQLYIKLYPKIFGMEIMVPVYQSVRVHEDYTNQIGISIGMFTMLTTSEGHRYGEHFGEYQAGYAEWIQDQTRSYQYNREDNPGRKKYRAKKKKMEEQLHGYINQELNRFLQCEKPQVIYMIKLPKTQANGKNRTINHHVNMWQRGYIRIRLEQKCREQSVKLVEVLGKDISRECSFCGRIGSLKDGMFVCESCGCTEEKKINAARNAKKRGQEGKIIY